MSCMKSLVALFILTFSSHFLFAQASADANNTFTVKGITLTEVTDQDWAIYNDESSNTYYIDFEKITFNLNEIVVMDEEGKEVFKEEVFDLPVNTIYEIDLSDYTNGRYRIELRSFTKFIQQEVEVK